MSKLQIAVSNGVNMCKFFLLSILIFAASCSAVNTQEIKTQPFPEPQKELKINIPNASWVKNFFEGVDKNDQRGIDKIAEHNSIYKLRETILPENDFEIRIWVGFGKAGNDGLILKRSCCNTWTATYLSEMSCHFEKRGKFNLESPKSGWDEAWRKLTEVGILTLPDSSELKYHNNSVDGKAYVVETSSDYTYRTYEYSNPKDEKLKEAEQMTKIGQIIADEFGLESFSSDTNGCGKNE